MVVQLQCPMYSIRIRSVKEDFGRPSQAQYKIERPRLSTKRCTIHAMMCVLDMTQPGTE